MHFCNAETIIFGEYFDTSNVKYMSYMFAFCNSLISLDIRNASFGNVVSTSNMFHKVPSSSNIIVKSDTERNWLSNVRSDFSNIQTVAELEVEEES